MGTCEEDQVIRNDGSRNRDISPTAEVPKTHSCFRIVTRGFPVAVHDQINPVRRFVNCGSAPGGNITAGSPPDLLPVFQTERRNE